MAGKSSLVTFSNPDPATYWDESGLLRTSAANEPRFSHDPATKAAVGWVIEGQATNSLLLPRDASASGWSGAASVSVNAVGIDGLANAASTITDSDSGASQNRVKSVSVPADTSINAAAWYIAKDNDETRFVALRAAHGVGEQRTIHLNTATGAASVEAALTTGGSHLVIDRGDFWEVWIFVQNNGGASLAFYIYPARATVIGTANNAAVGSCVYDYGQVINTNIVTHPILSTASAVTRSADSVSSVIGSEFSSSNFKIFVDCYSPLVYRDFSPLFEYSDGTSDNICRAMFYSDGTLRVLIVSAGVTQLAFTSAVIAAGSRVKIALRVVDGDLGVSVNGAAATANSGSAPLGLSRRDLGKAPESSSQSLNSSVLAWDEPYLPYTNTDLSTVTAL